MIIGITGSFGTGKTTVANFFREFGAEVIDADEIAHRLIRGGSDIYGRIVRFFGKKILSKEGTIDRSKLAKVAFSKKEFITRLCKIIHPEIIKRIREIVKKIQIRKADSIIVVDAPLLIEAGLNNFVDKVLVVKTTRRMQIKRCKKKGFEDRQIDQRIDAQMPLEDKLKFADFVICNEGSLSQTKRQVKKVFKEILKKPFSA